MQAVLYQNLIDMTKLLAPILVHTDEEVWSHTPHVKEEGSVAKLKLYAHLYKTIKANIVLTVKSFVSINYFSFFSINIT